MSGGEIYHLSTCPSPFWGGGGARDRMESPSISAWLMVAPDWLPMKNVQSLDLTYSVLNVRKASGRPLGYSSKEVPFVWRQWMKNILGKAWSFPYAEFQRPPSIGPMMSFRDMFNCPCWRVVTLPSCVSPSIPPQKEWLRSGQENMLLVKGLRKIYCPLNCLWLPEKSLKWKNKSSVP